MKRYLVGAFMALSFAASACTAFAADGDSRLSSDTGNLLRGALYKQSGMVREGVITIRTAWKLPAGPPAIRYDFDIIYGTIDKNLFSFLMADIAEIAFLPIEDGGQPVNIKLRNGLVRKVVLTSDSKGLLGTVNVHLKEVDVLTDTYGENIIMGGDVSRIEFYPPAQLKDEDMPGMVEGLGKALEVGKRDGLVDDNFLVVLKNLQRKMKAKLAGESGKSD